MKFRRGKKLQVTTASTALASSIEGACWQRGRAAATTAGGSIVD